MLSINNTIHYGNFIKSMIGYEVKRLLLNLFEVIMKKNMLASKLKHTCLSAVANITPLRVLQKRYQNKPDDFSVKLLCYKAMHLIAKKDVDSIVDNNKYISFDWDTYNYKVFNMCYMSNLLGKALFATSLGAVPSFDILDADGDNYFAQYFNEIPKAGDKLYYDKKYANSKRNVPGIHWDMSRTERIAYQKLYQRYFVLKDEIKEQYDEETRRIKRIIGDKQATGVVLRGTDYVLTRPKGHPIQPEIAEVVEVLKKDFSDNYYYVATDEERLLNVLKEYFGERVITSDSVYFDSIYDKEDKRISYVSFDRDNDKYLRGFEYYRKLYVMSQLDNVAFGMSGASRMVLIMRRPAFKNERILYRGLY